MQEQRLRLNNCLTVTCVTFIVKAVLGLGSVFAMLIKNTGSGYVFLWPAMRLIAGFSFFHLGNGDLHCLDISKPFGFLKKYAFNT